MKVILESKNLILYLDEIFKFGWLFEVFVVIDFDKNSYFLGMCERDLKWYWIYLNRFWVILILWLKE